jgi:hypothetical protein
VAEAARHGRRERPGYFVCEPDFSRRRRKSVIPSGPITVWATTSSFAPSGTCSDRTGRGEQGHAARERRSDLPSMLSGIRSAQRTITFKNFLFREGEISDDRIGERNNQRNEREHHFKSALLLGSFYICRKTAPIPKVPPSKRLGSNADSAPKYCYGSR